MNYTIFILAIFAVVISSTSFVRAQTAQQTATGEQGNDYLMGGTSIVMGAATMKFSCPSAHTNPASALMCYVMGPSLIVTGVSDLAKGSGRDSTIAPLTATPPPTVLCENDPTNPLCSGSNPYPTPYGGRGNPNPTGNPGGITPPTNTNGNPTGTSLPPAVAQALQDAQTTAAQYGVNPTSPTSIQAAAAANGVDYNSAVQQMGDLVMPADLQNAVNNAKNNFLKKMGSGIGTSDVDFESGGGGRKPGQQGKDEGLSDINSLLKGLQKGSGDDRGPASIDGLQKNFNGNAIGVAGDDIFKIVTRRYQKKIKDQTIGGLGLKSLKP